MKTLREQVEKKDCQGRRRLRKGERILLHGEQLGVTGGELPKKMDADLKDNLIDWLKCAVFVVVLFAISTGIVLGSEAIFG